MKKMNKLMNLAVVAIVIFSMSSCAKTQFQPGNLVGTWTMTEEIVSTTFTSEFPENVGTPNRIKSETNSELNYTPNGLTGFSESISTYDPTGAGGLSSISDETEYEGDMQTETSTNIVSGTPTTTIRVSDIVTTKNYSITFEKDRTFSIVDNTKTLATLNDSGSGYTSVYVGTYEINQIATGTWAFIGADKNSDEKNKERIGLWFTSNKRDRLFEDKETYTDTDPTDFFDYADNSYTIDSEYSDEYTGNRTEPDMVWKMVESNNDEMTVTYTYDYSYTGKTKQTYTDNTGTTATIYDSEGKEISISTIKFSK